MDESLLWTTVAVSELVALWLIWRLWRSDDHPIFKVALSVIALFPVLGPIFAAWIGHFPPAQPHALRDLRRRSTDVFDRWRDVFEETNPVKRFRKWRGVMEQKHDEDL